MIEAFGLLDQEIDKPLTLILGGGGCMILAHQYPLATLDVDALPLQWDFESLDPLVKKIAKKLDLPGDWLNPYFSSFTHVLPEDYHTRLIRVFAGKCLRVEGLGKEDMLLMKCFAHRPKDVGHARALLRAGADAKLVEGIIERLQKKKLPQAQEALDFLDELLAEMS